MSAADLLRTRQQAAVAPGVGSRAIFADRAENAELWDVDGKRYIDFAAGIAVNNTGHRHPRIMQAVSEQASRFTHTCFHVAPYESYIGLAERLNAVAPTGSDNRTMLVTTGAEAVENAVKIARAYTKRSGIVAFGGAFHGRTLLGMALTGKVAPYKKNFGPFPAEIFHAPFPNDYLGVSVEDALRALDALFAADVDPERIAAIIVEPVQGEGGFNVAPPDFLKALRALADRHGIVLIADEVQSGMARTGRMFGIEHAGIAADIVTMAKGLAGGFPLSAVVGKTEIMSAAHTGGLGGTYAGNPLAVAAANAVLDVIEDERVENPVRRRKPVDRSTLKTRLKNLAARQGMERIGDVRGLGAMVAFELVTDRASRQADAQLTSDIVAAAEQHGLILLSCGTRQNVIRLLPPLTIDDATLEEGLNLLERSVEVACSTIG